MSVTGDILKKEFYAVPTHLVFEALDTGHGGLSKEEVARRQESFGPNKLPESKNHTRLKVFANQFRSPLIIILLLAAATTALLKEYTDTAVIMAAVLFNTILGFYQENKAEEALTKMKTYLVERTVVIRDGREREVGAEELVPGDVIKLGQGSRVSADARIVVANGLFVDESVITGESLPEEKFEKEVAYDAPLADRTSMVYSGSLVSEGACQAVVTATGVATEIGKIALSVRETKRDATPLQKAIARFSGAFGLFVAVAVIFLFVVGLALGRSLLDMFLISVAVAVASVPESLPIVLTVVLAVGVQRLAARKGVVRKLLAAETLGGTTIILTDKTGTLTEAKMEMEATIDYGGSGELLLKIIALNADVIIENPHDSPDRWQIIGSRHLEASLVRGAARLGVLKPLVESELKPIDKLPFNAQRKYSATFFMLHQKPVVGFLGAPEVLLGGSEFVYEHGSHTPLSKEQKEDIYEEVDDLAYAGKRVLGVGMRFLDDGLSDIQLRQVDALVRGVVFLGLVTLSDPVRPTVKDAMKKIRDAGVRVVIATGDHQGTAESVAKEVGMPIVDGSVMNGDELGLLSDETLAERLDRTVIYSRISPDGKLRILKSFQARGEVVAMTGDGVNDAPALKSADIGVALGSGTDVAKDVADLVLLDDNFSTLVAAIEEGRKILRNIRKSIVYLLSSGFTELILVGGSLFTSLSFSLEAFAVQILWINMFSDSFPALSLAFEREEDDVMKMRPQKQSRGRLFDAEMKVMVFIAGLLTDLLLFGSALWLHSRGVEQGLLLTAIFAALGVGSILYVFSIRNLSKSIFSMNPFANTFLNMGVAFGLIMIAAAVYSPALNSFLHTVPLPAYYWIGIFAFGIINILSIEVVKALFRYFRKAAARGS